MAQTFASSETPVETPVVIAAEGAIAPPTVDLDDSEASDDSDDDDNADDNENDDSAEEDNDDNADEAEDD